MKAKEPGWAVVATSEAGRRYFVSSKFYNRCEAMTDYLENNSQTYQLLRERSEINHDELISVLWRNQSRRDRVKLVRVVLTEVS